MHINNRTNTRFNTSSGHPWRGTNAPANRLSLQLFAILPLTSTCWLAGATSTASARADAGAGATVSRRH